MRITRHRSSRSAMLGRRKSIKRQSSMGLEMVEIVMKVEDHFGVSVPDEVASKCVTVADLQRAVVDLLVRKGVARSPDLEAAVYVDLVRIIVDQTGMNETDIKPESKWVGDITDYG